MALPSPVRRTGYLRLAFHSTQDVFLRSPSRNSFVDIRKRAEPCTRVDRDLLMEQRRNIVSACFDRSHD